MSTGHRDLRRRLREGDRAAFDGVYAEHVDGVFTLAHRLTGSWASAEGARGGPVTPTDLWWVLPPGRRLST